MDIYDLKKASKLGQQRTLDQIFDKKDQILLKPKTGSVEHNIVLTYAGDGKFNIDVSDIDIETDKEIPLVLEDILNRKQTIA